MNVTHLIVAISFNFAAMARWSGVLDHAIRPATLVCVGWVLLHFLWQGATVAALLAIALRLLHRHSARVRYRVACAALLAMAVAPMATLWVVVLETSAMTEGPARSVPTSFHFLSGKFDHPTDEGGSLMAGSPPMAASRPELTVPTRSVGLTVTPWTWIVAAWAIGVVGLSTWRAGGWLHLRWLVRRTTPIGGAWTDRLQVLADQMAVRSPVRLAEAAWVAVPCVMGYFRPIILVPAAALAGLTPAQLEAILAHELAHVRRHDYLVNLAQAALETVLFYHPAVWWVSARVREEREYCCDDVAAATRPGPADYADALAAAEALRDDELRLLPTHLALGALRGRADGPLVRRVRRVLGLPPIQRRSGVSKPPLTAIAIAAACVVLPWVIAKADKAPTSAPSAQASAAIAPAAGPATRPTEGSPIDELAAAAGPPTSEDVVAHPQDYRIGPNDLLTFEIADLVGPGIQTTKTLRVSETGKVMLPYLRDVKAAGKTAAELQDDVVKEYQEQSVIAHAQVSFVVTEARGRRFSVLGGVPQPGEYAIPSSDFRLLDALALSKADVTQLDTIYVVRTPKGPEAVALVTQMQIELAHAESAYGENNPALAAARQRLADAQAHRPRVIAVPAGGLAAGVPSLNVAIQPGDMVIARGLVQSPARLVVNSDDGLTFGGEATTWAALPDRLGRIPASERARTSLVIVPATDQMTLRQMNDASQRAAALVKEYGFRDVQVLTVPTVPTSMAPAMTVPAAP